MYSLFSSINMMLLYEQKIKRIIHHHAFIKVTAKINHSC